MSCPEIAPIVVLFPSTEIPLLVILKELALLKIDLNACADQGIFKYPYSVFLKTSVKFL